MKLYSDFAAARTAQVIGDLVAIVVIVVGILVGIALHAAIAAFESIGRNVEQSGSSFSTTMSQIGTQLQGVPLIGGAIRSPFDAAGDAGTTLATAGTQWQDGVERFATGVGVTVAVLVALIVIVGWIVPRLVRSRRRGSVARWAKRDPDLDLLAFRALAARPQKDLARVDPDAITAWRRGDVAVIRGLAAVELRASGIRLRDAGASGR